MEVEYLSLDTAKRLHKEKDNKIDKNILEANIKLVDENKQLQQQCKKQKEVIDKAIEYITSAIENDDIEELKSARHLMLWNEDLDKLLEILKGSE